MIIEFSRFDSRYVLMQCQDRHLTFYLWSPWSIWNWYLIQSKNGEQNLMELFRLKINFRRFCTFCFSHRQLILVATGFSFITFFFMFYLILFSLLITLNRELVNYYSFREWNYFALHNSYLPSKNTIKLAI